MRSALPSLTKNLFYKHPTFNVLFVTNRCNLNCKMCFYTRREKRNELSAKEIHSLASSLPPQWYIMLTGGEPFLRDDIPDITQSFYENGAHNIHISTNATLPDKMLPDVERICANAKNSRVIIVSSIDGPKDLHDMIRGRKGAYDKTKDTLKTLMQMKRSYPNLGVGVNFTYSSYNQDVWKKTIDMIRNDIGVDTVNIGLARGNTNEKDAKNYNLNGYWEAHRYLIKENRREYFGMFEKLLALFKDVTQVENVYKIALGKTPKNYQCLAGRVFNVITEEGDVYPCEMLSKKMGNLRNVDMDFMKIWNSEEAKKIRAYIKTGACLCTYECAMTASLAASFNTLGYFFDFIMHYNEKTKEYYDA